MPARTAGFACHVLKAVASGQAGKCPASHAAGTVLGLLQRLADNVSFALENFDRADEKTRADERIEYLASNRGTLHRRCNLTPDQGWKALSSDGCGCSSRTGASGISVLRGKSKGHGTDVWPASAVRKISTPAL
jgi:hypothetical protein